MIERSAIETILGWVLGTFSVTAIAKVYGPAFVQWLGRTIERFANPDTQRANREQAEASKWKLDQATWDRANATIRHQAESIEALEGKVTRLEELDEAKAKKIEALERRIRRNHDVLRKMWEGVQTLILQVRELGAEPKYHPPSWEELANEGE